MRIQDLVRLHTGLDTNACMLQTISTGVCSTKGGSQGEEKLDLQLPRTQKAMFPPMKARGGADTFTMLALSMSCEISIGGRRCCALRSKHLSINKALYLLDALGPSQVGTSK
jgi:hypothetical protein